MRWAALAALVLAGCAGPGTQIQAECEALHKAFVPMFQCTYDGIVARAPRVLQDDRAKLYLLKGEQLAAAVYQGRISDLDARVEWQRLFVDLKAAKVQEELAVLNAVQAARPTTVNCTSTRIGANTYTTCQ